METPAHLIVLRRNFGNISFILQETDTEKQILVSLFLFFVVVIVERGGEGRRRAGQRRQGGFSLQKAGRLKPTGNQRASGGRHRAGVPSTQSSLPPPSSSCTCACVFVCCRGEPFYFYHLPTPASHSAGQSVHLRIHFSFVMGVSLVPGEEISQVDRILCRFGVTFDCPCSTINIIWF